MSSGKGLYKLNAVIMKMDAQSDYDTVAAICKELNLSVIEPKGKTAWKIEDATAAMLKSVPPDRKMILVKGLDYYFSI